MAKLEKLFRIEEEIHNPTDFEYVSGWLCWHEKTGYFYFQGRSGPLGMFCSYIDGDEMRPNWFDGIQRVLEVDVFDLFEAAGRLDLIDRFF